MNIIFLDIDGVLNSLDYFIERHPKVLELYDNTEFKGYIQLRIKRMLLDLDLKKIKILKQIIDKNSLHNKRLIRQK